MKMICFNCIEQNRNSQCEGQEHLQLFIQYHKKSYLNDHFNSFAIIQFHMNEEVQTNK